jgi:hypothetical protein
MRALVLSRYGGPECTALIDVPLAEISAGLAALELLQALKVTQVTDNQFAQSSPSVTVVVGARR